MLSGMLSGMLLAQETGYEGGGAAGVVVLVMPGCGKVNDKI
ncbi:MAG: hypothetical protein ABFS37_01325 [Acidobacteriota bacterium]